MRKLIHFLDVFGNRISGFVPSQLGKLPADEAIYLSNNLLSGVLP